jgi:signal transduction histidine kinase
VFAFAAAVMIASLILPVVIGYPEAFEDTFLSGLFQTVGLPAVPLLTGLAIVRYQLFDIDRLISRTLLYASLTAIVILGYIAVVGYLGVLFHSEGNLLISIVATGIVAVAFQPLRITLQRGVDRFVYGKKAESYAVLAGLDRRLEESLAADAVLPAILGAIDDALHPISAAIALRSDDEEILAASIGSEATPVVRLPISYQGEPVGSLLLGPRVDGEDYSPSDLALLGDLTRHAGAAVYGIRLTAELRRSREQLVVAREEERRRLRRDLHDQLAPALAGIGLSAASAERLLDSDPAKARAVIAKLQASIRDAVGDVRRVAHDLRPPALDELGLVDALRERAGEFTEPSISIDVPDALPPLPAAVEVAVYRIVQEALMNVQRHANARTCRVCMTSSSVELEVEVLDDGDGIPDDFHGGVGLRSIRERAEELGGTAVISRVEPTGTRVLVHIPIAADAA